MNRTVEPIASPSPPRHAPAEQVPARPGGRRRMLIALLALVMVAGGISALALAGAPSTSIPTVTGRAPQAPLARARYDAQAFLTRFMASDGRVIRRDQGGDTVSEGQGYAMLLAIAAGNQRDFNLAWQWDVANLQMADHLSSYHWQSGTVVGKDAASDADLDMAWALVLGAKRFHDPSYRAAGLEIASAILANETVTVSGKLELVAGPWARGAPFAVDPSYFSPEAMSALAVATGDPRWTQLLDDTTSFVVSLDQGSHSLRLPSDWAKLGVTGDIQPAGAPSSSSQPSYGLDAQRVPVWYAAGCSTKLRSVSAATWPILQSAAGRGGRLAYSLSGQSESKLTNPLGIVAAAGAADATGDKTAAAQLLDRADAASAKYHTYYGDAWVALGRVLLDTRLLSSCPPSPT